MTQEKNINWAQISNKWKFFAVDSNGKGFLFTDEAFCGVSSWGSVGMYVFFGYYDCANWQNSLQKRPN